MAVRKGRRLRGKACVRPPLGPCRSWKARRVSLRLGPARDIFAARGRETSATPSRHIVPPPCFNACHLGATSGEICAAPKGGVPIPLLLSPPPGVSLLASKGAGLAFCPQSPAKKSHSERAAEAERDPPAGARAVIPPLFWQGLPGGQLPTP